MCYNIIVPRDKGQILERKKEDGNLFYIVDIEGKRVNSTKPQVPPKLLQK